MKTTLRLIAAWAVFCFGAAALQAQFNCGPDTVLFTEARGTAFQVIGFQGAGTGAYLQATGQYYPVIDSIEVRGAVVPVYTPAASNPTNTIVQAVCQLFQASNITGDPIGPMLGADTLNCDTTFGVNGTSTFKIATWPAVVVNGPYVIIVRHLNPTSTIQLATISNDFIANNGLGFNYGRMGIYSGGTLQWLNGTAVDVGGGINFDADWQFYPIVRYRSVNTLTEDTFTVCAGDPILNPTNRSFWQVSQVYNSGWYFDTTNGTGNIAWGNGGNTSPNGPYAYPAPGTFTITYNDTIETWSGANCFSTDQAVAVVTAPPSIVVSPGNTVSFCNGTSVTLNTNGTAGAAGYTWTWYRVVSPGFNAPVASGTTYTVDSSTVLLVDASITGSLCADRDTVFVTELNSGGNFISGPQQFCAGNSVVLNAPAGFAGYVWSTGPTTQSITLDSSATLTVTLVNTAPACSLTSAPFVVIENPLPVVNITQSNDTLYSSQPGPALQWFRDGTLIAGATGAFYKPTQTGNHYVRLTNPSTGCVGFSDTVSFTVGFAESLNDLGVVLFPNPTDAQFTLAYTGTQAGVATVVMRNLTGQVVFTQRVELGLGTQPQLEVAALPAGLYIAEVLLNGRRALQRVVIE